METKISPIESPSRRRRRILAAGDVVNEYTSAVIPGITTKAKVSVVSTSPIMSKATAVLVNSYRSSYISSIPKIENLLGPLIEI